MKKKKHLENVHHPSLEDSLSPLNINSIVHFALYFIQHKSYLNLTRTVLEHQDAMIGILVNFKKCPHLPTHENIRRKK